MVTAGSISTKFFLSQSTFGPAAENRLLGFLTIGYEIDDRVAAQVSRIAASQVAFYYGDTSGEDALSPMQELNSTGSARSHAALGSSGPEQIQLGEEHFLITSLRARGRRRIPRCV